MVLLADCKLEHVTNEAKLVLEIKFYCHVWVDFCPSVFIAMITDAILSKLIPHQ